MGSLGSGGRGTAALGGRRWEVYMAAGRGEYFFWTRRSPGAHAPRTGQRRRVAEPGARQCGAFINDTGKVRQGKDDGVDGISGPFCGGIFGPSIC